ncbi:MAG: glycosyltransferase family 39 protein [Planctomycetota bacterium]
MTSRVRKARASTWVVALLLAFFLGTNLLWHCIDHRPARWDEGCNLTFSERSHAYLKEGRLHKALYTHGATRPTFVPFLSSLTYFLIGDDFKQTVFLNNALSLIVISLCLYRLGILFLSPWAGVLAIATFPCYLNIIRWSHYYTLDLPLTAAVSLTILLLAELRRTDFAVKWIRVCFALTVFAGICIKHMYAPLVVLPIGLVLFERYRHQRSRGAGLKADRRFYIAFSVALFFGAVYHIYNHRTFSELMRRTLTPASSELATVGYTPPGKLQILQGLFDQEFGSPWFLALAIVGLLVACTIRPFPWLLLVWPLWGVVMFVFVVKVTMSYYFHPILPGLALLSWSWMVWRPKSLPARPAMAFQACRGLAAAVIVVLSLGFYLRHSLGTDNVLRIAAKAPGIVFAQERATSNPLVEDNYWTGAYVDGNVETLPFPHEWHIDDIFAAVAERVDAGQKERRSLVWLSGYEWLNNYTAEYYLLQHGLRGRLRVDHRNWSLKIYDPDELLQKSQFFVTKSGPVLKPDFYGIPWAEDYQAFAEHFLKSDAKVLRDAGYEAAVVYPLPDGTEATLWCESR